MKRLHLLALSATLLTGAGCADGPAALEPTAPELQYLSTAAGPPIAASGTFDAVVDFSTLTLTPRGSNCLLEVAGQLVFSGTIEGTAAGTTSALVFASCPEVGSNPPGTFADVFKSDLEFTGTVDGESAQASVLYQGRAQPGGRIDARILFSRGVAGVLDAEAQLAVGGSYSGSLVVR